MFADLFSSTPNSNQGNATLEGAHEGGTGTALDRLFRFGESASNIYRNLTDSDPVQTNARAAAPPVVTKAQDSFNTKTMMMIGAAVLALVLILSLSRK